MKKKLQNISINLVVYVSLLVVWHFGSNTLIPSPFTVTMKLFRIFPSILGDLGFTMLEAFAGLFIGVVFAVAMVILMELSHRLRLIVSPILVISQSIPFNVLAPIIVIVFGFGVLPKIYVVSLVCFFPLALNLLTAFDYVPQTLVDVATLFGASRWQKVWHLKMPLSLPSFFAGLKIGAVYCVTSAFVAEWMAGDTGLGVVMMRAKRSYDSNKVFAIVLLITVISILFYTILDAIQKKLERMD